MKTVITKSVEETRRVAKQLAKRLQPGDVLALQGNLGSGKTTFVQGLAEGLEVRKTAYVRSPTFTLINEYFGRLPLFHIDFYRLDRESDIFNLGLEEYINGKGVTVIEWAEKFPQLLPPRTYFLKFSVIDETTREITL